MCSDYGQKDPCPAARYTSHSRFKDTNTDTQKRSTFDADALTLKLTM